MHSDVADLLLQIERELRRLALWSDTPATQQQMMSREPFCIDTMTFPEWVQFVFIARLAFIIEQGAAFPTASDIAPMAEEYFKGAKLDGGHIVALIKQFDQLVTNH